MNKKALWLMVGVAVVVALVVVFYVYESPEGRVEDAQAREVRVGVVLPLSGDMAVFGENGREGLLLAETKLESEYPDLNIELLFQDSQGTPTGTVSAVRRLIDAQGVEYIVGGLTSSGVLAAAPYAQENGALFFSPAASAPGIPEIGNLVVRNWQSDTALAELFGRAAHERLGLDTVAILHVSNDYGQTNASSFRESFEEAGGNVLLVRALSEGTTEVKTLVTQVRGLQDLDGLLMAVYPDEYKALYQEMGSEGMSDAQLLATDTFYSPELLTSLGETAEGTICAVASKPEAGYEPREVFIEEYKSQFRGHDGQPKEPGLVSDTAYDALNLVVRGILETDGTPQAVSNWILSQEDYPGVAGLTTFTSTGDIEGGIALYHVQDEEFVRLAE